MTPKSLNNLNKIKLFSFFDSHYEKAHEKLYEIISKE